MKTMYKGLVNSPETTITNNIGTNDTIIYVLDPARVPSDLPNLMVLGTGTNAETIKVTAIEDNALTVERGFQGIAKDWLAGTIISRNFTEYDYAALVDNINELELTKETPDGAQAKADTAEGNAKTYASDLIGVLSNLKTTVKDKIVSAINELFDNLASHKADTAMHNNNGQLTFPATQNPSSNPNVLDDYEEGTWTPVVGRYPSSPEVTYTWQSGDYVKIGRLVFISAYISISGVTTAGSGLNQVRGLPFQPVGAAYQNTGAVFYNSALSTSTAMSVSTHPDDNCLYFKDATRGQTPMNVNWEAGHLSFCLVYLTYY